jgi:hypothetical protein
MINCYNQVSVSSIENFNIMVRLMIDECYLVLVRTPLFTFVRPLVLLIFIILTCFVCIVLIRFLHQELTKGAKWT